MRPLLKSIFVSTAITLLTAGLLLAEEGQQPTTPASPDAVTAARPQTVCPVMGGQIGPLDKALYVDVKGKRIYICCAACESAILADPDMYIKKIEKRGETVADAPSSPETVTPGDKKAGN